MTSYKLLAGLSLCLICFEPIAFSQSDTLALSSGTTAQGGTATLGLSLTSVSGGQVAGLQWTLNYSPSDVTAITVAPGSAATAANKSVACVQGTGTYMCLLAGMNNTVLGDGVAATVSVTLSPTVTTSTAISVTNALGASPSGSPVSVTGSGGTVTVLPPLGVSSLVCSPSSVITPGSSSCTVTLNQAVPANTAVTISGNNSNLTLPASATVTSGASSASFSATAATVATSQTAVITATLGSSSQTASLTLLPPLALVSLQCSPTTLGSGAASTCTVTLNEAPAANATVALSDNNANLSVPTSVTVASGTTSKTFNATAGTIGSVQTAVVTATLGSSSQTASISLLPPLALTSLACSPTSLSSGAISTCTVTLNQPAPSNTAVTLSDNSASLTVPASVTVASGATSNTFNATAGTIGSVQTAVVTATLGSSSQTASISLLPPLALTSLACSPTTLSSGANSTCTVTLNQPAPSNTAVTLSDNSASLTVPTSVTVASGATSNTFNATAGTIGSVQTAVVTATLGSSSQTASISLLPPLALTSLACSPTSLSSGAISTCTVTLNQPAPSNTAVTLSDNSASLTVPASVTVASGATSNTFNATAGTIGSVQTAVVTATLGSSSQTASISLLPPLALTSLACSPTSLSSGAISTCTVTLNQPAPSTTAVTLSDNSSSLSVPASVTVANGATSATFGATAGTITSVQTAVVTATLGSSSQTASISLLPPLAVASLGCAPSSLSSGASATCTVTMNQSAPSTTLVTLSDNNTNLTVPQSVTVAGGTTTSTFTVTAGTVGSTQTAIVTATFGSSSQTASMTLLPPLALSSVLCNPSSLSSGANSICTLTLNQSAPASTAVSVSDNNANLTVPASVTIANGASSGTFTASAGTIGSTQTAVVTATLGSSSQVASISLLPPLALASLQCNPSSLAAGGVSSCTVTLNQPAPTNTAVTISDNNAGLTVPFSVVVTSGATAATFSANAGSTISSVQTVTVTATLGSSSQTASVTLLPPLALASLLCSPTSLGAGATSTCTVSLNQPAPGSTTVTVSDNNTGLTVPASVSISSGATSVNFSATAAGTIGSTQTVVVTASLSSSTQTASVTLLPPLGLASVSCSPSSLSSGGGSTCTVTLNQAAPGSTTVTLSDNTSNLTVPASATVASGATNANFTATAGTITSMQTAVVTAALGSGSQTASVTLLPPLALASLQCNPATVNSGGTSTCTVSLNQPAPGNTTVTLTDNNPMLAESTSVTVPAGAASTTFTVTAGSISNTQTVVITATLGSSSQTASLTLLPVMGLASLQCNPSTMGSETVNSCTVTLNQAAPGVTTVMLSASNSYLTVPPSVNVASGATSATFTPTVDTMKNTETAVVTATLGSSSQTTTVTLLAALALSNLSCNPTSLAGGASSTCTVTTNRSAAANRTFAVSTNNSAGLLVPSSVTMPAGAASQTFSITAGSVSGQFQVIVSFAQASKWVKIKVSTKNQPNAGDVSVTSLVCAPTSLVGTATSTCTLGLSQPAPANGTGVLLATDAGLQIPAGVLVAAGSTTAQFQATGWISDSNQTADILAALPGGVATASLSIIGIQPQSVSCRPKAVQAGKPVVCEVQLNSDQIPNSITLRGTSSSTDLAVPVAIATRPMQSTLTFLSFTASGAKPQSETVQVDFGANSVKDSVSVIPGPGPALAVPGKQLAKPGVAVSFNVSAADSNGSVSLSASKLPAGASFNTATGIFQWTPKPAQLGQYSVVFTAADTLGLTATQNVAIEVDPGTPNVTGLTNGASQATGLSCSPDGIASLLGSWLVQDDSTWYDTQGPAKQFGGTQVTVNGAAVPLLYASGMRVDFLCPQLDPGTALQISLTTGAGQTSAIQASMQEATPGIFSLDTSGAGQGMIGFPGTSMLAVARNPLVFGEPAQPGDNVMIRVTGLPTTAIVSVTFGGVNGAVQSITAEGANPGVEDILVTVPDGAPTGAAIPVQIQYAQAGGGTLQSNVVTMAVEAVQP